MAQKTGGRLAPITERALIQRLRRALAKEGDRLIANRGGAYTDQMGRFWRVNSSNHIIDQDVDLEELGRELHVLQAWERLTE
jgi:hypothetical protein